MKKLLNLFLCTSFIVGASFAQENKKQVIPWDLEKPAFATPQDELEWMLESCGIDIYNIENNPPVWNTPYCDYIDDETCIPYCEINSIDTNGDYIVVTTVGPNNEIGYTPVNGIKGYCPNPKEQAYWQGVTNLLQQVVNDAEVIVNVDVDLDELNEITTNLTELCEKVDNLTEIVEGNLSNLCEKAENLIELNETICEKLDVANSNSTESTEILNSNIVELCSKVDSVSSNLTTLIEQNTTNTEVLVEINETISVLTGQIDAVCDKLEGIASNLEELVTITTEISSNTETIVDNTSVISSNIETLVSNSTELVENSELACDKLLDIANTLTNGDINVSIEGFDDLTNQVAEVCEKLETLNSNLCEKLDGLGDDASNTVEAVEDLCEKVEVMTNQLAELCEKTEVNNEILSSVTNYLSEVTNMLDNICDKFDSQSNALEEVVSGISNLCEKMESFTNILSEVLTEVTEGNSNICEKLDALTEETAEGNSNMCAKLDEILESLGTNLTVNLSTNIEDKICDIADNTSGLTNLTFVDCNKGEGVIVGDCSPEWNPYDPDQGRQWDNISGNGTIIKFASGSEGSFFEMTQGTNPQCASGDLWVGRYGAYNGPSGSGSLLAQGYIMGSVGNLNADGTYNLGAVELNGCDPTDVQSFLESEGFSGAEAGSLIANGYATVDVLGTTGVTHINGLFQSGLTTPFGMCITSGIASEPSTNEVCKAMLTALCQESIDAIGDVIGDGLTDLFDEPLPTYQCKEVCWTDGTNVINQINSFEIDENGVLGDVIDTVYYSTADSTNVESVPKNFVNCELYEVKCQAGLEILNATTPVFNTPANIHSVTLIVTEGTVDVDLPVSGVRTVPKGTVLQWDACVVGFDASNGAAMVNYTTK